MIQKHVLTVGVFALGFKLFAAITPFEINLVRNSDFNSDFNHLPTGWACYMHNATSFWDDGHARLQMIENGITIEGTATLMQFDMWDDIAPAYRLSCEMKTEGSKGARVSLRVRNQATGASKDTGVANKALDVWENLTKDIIPENHYGFAVHINVPQDSKLFLRNFKITALLPQTEVGEVLLSGKHAELPLRGIILPPDCSRADQLAAHELQVNLYRITGKALPVFTSPEPPQEKGYLCISNLKRLIPDEASLLLSSESHLGDAPEANGFKINTRDGNLLLIGGNDAGVLAGAIHLSEICGVKFYAPLFYTVAKKQTLQISDLNVMKHPAFEWVTGPAANQYTIDGWKYGYLYPATTVQPASWVHPPSALLPPILYEKEHPDYYALVDGKRVVDVSLKLLQKSKGYLNLCLGNPALQEAVAEKTMRLMDLYPQTKYFSIAQGDGPAWCQCELCKALDVNSDILTDRLIAYANAVATITSQKYPDRKLLVLAYAAKREDLPLREKLHPNVAVQYAFWSSSWPMWRATDCAQNQRGMQLLDDWNAFTGTNLTLFLYPVNTYENAEKIKLAASKGIRGFHHCGLRGDFPEVTLYTTGRLVWEPAADLEKLIDEVMPVVYGPATPYIRSYFDMHHALIRECVAEPSKDKLYSEIHTHKFRRLPLAYTEKALAILEKAEQTEGLSQETLRKIQAEKYKVLYGYINEYNALHLNIPEESFADYAFKLAELVRLARIGREPFAGYNIAFSEWLYQITGVLDFDREPYKWYNDKKIDDFLADPAATLKNRLYLQTELENGLEVEAKAWRGTRFYPLYQKEPAFVLRRRSSSDSQAKAFFKLDQLPQSTAKLELQGLDNDKAEIAEVEITLNGKKIFAGPIDYPKNKWGFQIYEIPTGVLQQGENLIAIQNTMGDYKDSAEGEPGPAEEALAANYSWGWCMFGKARFLWD